MKADDKFIKLARERFQLAEDADTKQRERELADLRFYAGDQWDTDLLNSRASQTIGSGTTSQTVPARPSLTINKTREPVRQVLNQERQSDLSIELIPADDFGEATGPIDHTEIELREGLVRRIQRDSEAADARTWAFARGTIAGRGYYLVMTRYVPGKSADQEVYVERIYNQASVLLDPTHEQPDGSDAEWGFYGTDLSWEVYKSEYPSSRGHRNRVSDCESDTEWRTLGDEAPGWFKTDGDGETRSVRVMNYYFTERTSQELYHLIDGSAAYDEELSDSSEPGAPRVLTANPGVSVLTDEDGTEQCHTQIEKTIKWAKIDGCQKLDETDWPGHFLPIIKVLGEELQPYDQERRCEGIVRPMRDACKGNNYIISKFVERVGLTPIPPWMMAGGQDEGYEAEYDAANTRTLSRLHYNLKDTNGQPAPPPFRTDSRAEIADIGMGVQLFGQAIASTSVVPETALGNADPTVKSGKLAKLLLDQANRGTSNFLDNLVRSMRHEARVINDLLFPIYGRPGRLARMMNGQGEMSSVLIDQPFTMQGDGKQANPVPAQPGQAGAKHYRLTEDANFNVAVKIGRNQETRRQEVAQALLEFIGADPAQMAIIGDKLWKYLDVPDHDEMAERYKVMLAPPIQQLLSGKEGPTPEQLQQELQKATQMMEALSAELDAKNRLIETDGVKAQQRVAELTVKENAENERELAQITSDEAVKMAELDLKRRELEVKLEIEMAKLGSASSMARAELEQQDLHHHDETQLREQERLSAEAQADMDRQAEAEQAASQQAFQASESSQDRDLAKQQAAKPDA